MTDHCSLTTAASCLHNDVKIPSRAALPLLAGCLQATKMNVKHFINALFCSLRRSLVDSPPNDTIDDRLPASIVYSASMVVMIPLSSRSLSSRY